MSSKGLSGCRQDRKAQQNVKRLRIQRFLKGPVERFPGLQRVVERVKKWDGLNFMGLEPEPVTLELFKDI